MVTYGGLKAGQSPYIAKAFDVNAIRVGDIPDGIVGKPVTFIGKTLVIKMTSFPLISQILLEIRIWNTSSFCKFWNFFLRILKVSKIHDFKWLVF